MKCISLFLIILILISYVFNDLKSKSSRKKWFEKTFNKLKSNISDRVDAVIDKSNQLSTAAKNMIKINTYSWRSNGVAKQNFIFNKEERIKDFSADVAEYWTNIAGYGYCPYEKMITNKCCKNYFDEGNYIFVAAEKIKKDNYNIGIIRSDKYKKVVIVFPGTRNIKQLLTEFVQSKLKGFDDSKTIKVLKYFNIVYNQIKNLIFPHIKSQQEKYPDYQFIFTGHSLGGAMATLFSLGAVRSKIVNQSEDSPVLITFGAPRPGNDIFANEVMINIPIVFRVVTQGDPVAVVPPCKSDAENTKCLSVLPEGKFVWPSENPENNENDNSANLPNSNYYSQIGGLKLFNKEFDDYNECGKEQGEFDVDDACHSKRTTEINFHVIYSRIRIGSVCSIRRKLKKFK
jgi:hypothetical protein